MEELERLRVIVRLQNEKIADLTRMFIEVTEELVATLQGNNEKQLLPEKLEK